MGKYIEHEMKIQELSNSLKLEICLTFDDLVLQILLLSRSFQSYRDKKLNIIKQVLIKTYYYNYLLEKTHFSLEKTFVSRELNIFARINFHECHQLKYFAVSNFCEFAKKSQNCEMLFRKSFLLSANLEAMSCILFTLCSVFLL